MIEIDFAAGGLRKYVCDPSFPLLKWIRTVFLPKLVGGVFLVMMSFGMCLFSQEKEDKERFHIS